MAEASTNEASKVRVKKGEGALRTEAQRDMDAQREADAEMEAEAAIQAARAARR